MLAQARKDTLPDNVKLNFRPVSTTNYVVWLHNLNEANVTVPASALQEDPSKPITLEELALSANQLRSDMLQRKMTWNGVKPSLDNVYRPGEGNNFIIWLFA